MDDSILTGTKKILGLAEANEAFDWDIIVFINGALSTAEQAGAGLIPGFSIQSKDDMWASLGLTPQNLALLKNYVFLKVKYLFDPPATSYTQEAMAKQIEEMETRMQINTNLEALA